MGEEAYYYLLNGKKAIRNSQSLEQYYQIIAHLKKAFFFDEVESIFSSISYGIRLPKNTEFQYNFCKFVVCVCLIVYKPCSSINIGFIM